MKNPNSCITVMALVFLMSCTPTTLIYDESTNPQYAKPDPRIRYHCKTMKDCNRYFEAIGHHIALTDEPQRINVKDHRGLIYRGKMSFETEEPIDPEEPKALKNLALVLKGKLVFVGSIYDPDYRQWVHNVRIEFTSPPTDKEKPPEPGG